MFKTIDVVRCWPFWFAIHCFVILKLFEADFLVQVFFLCHCRPFSLKIGVVFFVFLVGFLLSFCILLSIFVWCQRFGFVFLYYILVCIFIVAFFFRWCVLVFGEFHVNVKIPISLIYVKFANKFMTFAYSPDMRQCIDQRIAHTERKLLIIILHLKLNVHVDNLSKERWNVLIYLQSRKRLYTK